LPISPIKERVPPPFDNNGGERRHGEWKLALWCVFKWVVDYWTEIKVRDQEVGRGEQDVLVMLVKEEVGYEPKGGGGLISCRL
jgi:hypothetical protein